MVLINCPECTKKVSSEAVSCPKCGYPVAQKYKEYEEQAREARKAREDRELAKKIEEATKRAIANKKAREEGREEGEQVGMLKVLSGMVQDNVISLAEAAKRMKMTVAKFKNAAKKVAL